MKLAERWQNVIEQNGPIEVNFFIEKVELSHIKSQNYFLSNTIVGFLTRCLVREKNVLNLLMWGQEEKMYLVNSPFGGRN